MRKILKIFVILALLIPLILLFLWIKYKNRPEMVTPYPYVIEKTKWKGAKEAADADILVVGDRMGMKLSKLLPAISKEISKDLKGALKTFNWSTKHEGLHRTLAKLKSLKQLPPIIIYHGTSKEFYERKFNVLYAKNILKNIEKFRDDLNHTLIMTFPFLSRFMYLPQKTIHLDDKIMENKINYPPNIKQQQMKLLYKIFELELEDFIDLIRTRKSNLIFVTAPINLRIGPKRICKNTTNIEIEQKLKGILKLFESGDFKSSANEMAPLLETAIANAQVHFMAGTIYRKLGTFDKARNLLQKASAFDCETYRSNAVFNAIVTKYAKKYEFPVIDFDRQVNSQWKKDDLFQDDIYPGSIHYHKLGMTLSKRIIEILAL